MGPDHTAVSFPLAELGVLRLGDEELEQARELMGRAVEIRERAMGRDHPDMLWLLRSYAALHVAEGDVEGAVELYRRALSIAEHSYGPDHIDVARNLSSVAYYMDYTDLDAKRELFERSLAIRQKTFGPRHLFVAATYYNLGCLAAVGGDRDRALEWIQEALDCGWSWDGVFEDNDLDSLRGDPEFEAMLDEIRRRLAAG